MNPSVPSYRVVILTEPGSEPDPIREALQRSDLRVVRALALSSLDNGGGSPKADAVVVTLSGEPEKESFTKQLARIECPVVVCTDPVDRLTLRWMLDHGVDGVVWNVSLGETLPLTVRTVLAGQLVVPSAFRRQSTTPDLTNREKQALSLVIMGLTNREIASKLYISESTVKSHLNTAYRKLGVGSRVEAAELITDPEVGLGTGILAITSAGHSRSRRRDL